MFFDEYGYPDEERALAFLNNTINSYIEKGDTRALSSFKRKNPQNFKQAFSADGEFSLYDPEKLNNQLDIISWGKSYTERGRLDWKDGYRIKKPIVNSRGDLEYVPSEIEWIPDINGKFEKVKGWFPKSPNDVYYDSGSYRPNNNFAMRIGCDPFRYDKTKDKRRSNCASFAYQMADPIDPSNFYNDMFVLRYAYREESTRQSNEDILKMAWWCGCQVLFERNINHWKNDFSDWECAAFLTWINGEVEPGIITAGTKVQTICNYTEAYQNKYIHKVYFKSLIRKETGWLGFKIEDTEKFDEPMAAGITLIAVRDKVYSNPNSEKINMSAFFRKTG